MRILVPTGIFHPELGGPATYLYAFLPELQKRGHEVEVITFGAAPTEGYPYPLTRIPRRNILRRNWDYYQAVRARLPHVDGVFVNSLGLSLPKLPKPSVLKIVGDRAWERCVNRGWIAPNEDIDGFQTRRYAPHIEWVKRMRAQEARAADFIIVPSEYLRQMVIGWGIPAQRVQVIYNAFEPSNINIEPLRKSDLGLNERTPLLLFVGRLTPWKGLDYVLQALQNISDAQLFIIGTGTEQPQLEALAAQLGLSEQVRFLGQMSAAAVARYYGVADYTLLYSGYEGLSHVLLESLHAGTPILASAKGGNLELVQHEVNGLFVPYPDPAVLAEILRYALEPATQARLKAGAKLDPSRFAWGNLVEQTITCLETQFSR